MNPLKIFGALAAIAISVPVVVYSIAQSTEPPQCPTAPPPSCTTGMHLFYPPATAGSSCPSTPYCVADTVASTSSTPNGSGTGMQCPTPSDITCAPGTHKAYPNSTGGPNICPPQPYCQSDVTAGSPSSSSPTGSTPCPYYPPPTCSAGMHSYYAAVYNGSCPTAPTCVADGTQGGGYTSGSGSGTSGGSGGAFCPSVTMPTCGPKEYMYSELPAPGAKCPSTPSCKPMTEEMLKNQNNPCPYYPAPTCTTGMHVSYPSMSAGQRCPSPATCVADTQTNPNTTNFCPPMYAPTCALDEEVYSPPVPFGAYCSPASTCRRKATPTCSTSTGPTSCPVGQTLMHPSVVPGATCPPTPYCAKSEEKPPIPVDVIKVPVTTCPVMPTVTSCGPNEELASQEYKGCGTYAYCKPKPVVDIKPVPCPAVASETSCPTGKVLKTVTGACPYSYCVADEQPQEPPVTRAEVDAALRQIKSQGSEVSQLLTRAKRDAPAVSSDLDALAKKLQDFATRIADKAVTRATMQEYFDAGISDLMNTLRQKIDSAVRSKQLAKDLGKELKGRRTALTNLSTALNAKKPDDAAKLLGGLGINTDALVKAVAEDDSVLSAGEQLLKALPTGDDDTMQNAEQLLSDLRSGDSLPPAAQYDGLRVLLRDLTQRYGRPLALVSDAEVRDALLGFLSDAVDSINGSDYQAARQTVQAFPPEVRSFFTRARTVTAANRTRFLQQIQDLRDRLP